MKYRHIIWDWNGTLLNDAAECTAVVDKLMQKHNLGRLSQERYRKETCFPVINFYIALGFDFQKVPFTEIARDYIEQYDQLMLNSSLHDESRLCLTNLTAAGYTHSVLSAYEQIRLEKAISHFGLTDYFLKIIGLSDYFAHSKKDNGIKWINELPYDKEQVLFIGDTTHDHEVALAMGVDCILMTNGHQSPEHFDQTHRQTFNNLGEVCQWLLS
ncbi:MAG: HAD family hydrolase [Sedimentisphaerales bacterium]|nr:HAD family hydrolase [Sedimentisphaerales bacterium]